MRRTSCVNAQSFNLLYIWFVLSTTAIPGSQYTFVSVSPILSQKIANPFVSPGSEDLGGLWSLRFGARRMAGEAEQWPNTAAEAASTDSPRRGESWRDLTPLKWWCSIWLFKQAGGTSFGKHLKGGMTAGRWRVRCDETGFQIPLAYFILWWILGCSWLWTFVSL